MRGPLLAPRRAKRSSFALSFRRNPRNMKHPPITLIHGRTPDVFSRVRGPFDVLLTDPPYNSKRKSYFALSWQKHQNRDFGEWDAVENADCSWLASVVHDLLADDAAILICSPFERLGDYETALEALGCTYKTAIVWHKTNGVVLQNRHRLAQNQRRRPRPRLQKLL